MNNAHVLALSIVALVPTWSLGCKKPPPDEPPPPPTISSARETVPPAAPFNATPAAQFADSGSADGQTPLDQARSYKEAGQLWMARLVLENRALSASGTKDEAELLLAICMEQGDATCVENCGDKLNRKIKFDGGTRPAASASVAASAPEHKEPDTELARARDMVLKMQYADARKVLEPKVLDGKATRAEIAMLKTICEKEGDRMCVALCNTKLK